MRALCRPGLVVGGEMEKMKDKDIEVDVWNNLTDEAKIRDRAALARQL